MEMIGLALGDETTYHCGLIKRGEGVTLLLIFKEVQIASRSASPVSERGIRRKMVLAFLVL